MLAFNYATDTEEQVPDGFAGLDAQQVAAFVPPTVGARDCYAQQIADGATPLDAWLHTMQTALGIARLTA